MGKFEPRGNYPNPFNSTTNISFSLPERTEVTIRVFDINGRSVETLTQSEFNAGHHSLSWNATGQTSGTYLYQMRAGVFVETR